MWRISPRKYVLLVLFVSALIIVMWYIRGSPRQDQVRTYKVHFHQTSRQSHHIHQDQVHNGETYFRSPDRQKSDHELCLHSNPPVHEEEFTPNFIGSKGGFVCGSDYVPPIMWEINFNIERHFRFCANRKDCPEVTLQGIPKRFHFIWSTAIIPDVFVDNLKAFRRLHPKWKIHFWTIKSGRKFIENREPQLLIYFDNYRREVDRADMLRYVILYYYGGAYFDLDSTPVKPLDILTKKYNCIVGPEPIENAVVVLKTRSVLANSAIMCVPKHAFLRFLVDSLPLHGRRLAGPPFFSNCFNSYIRSHVSPTVNQGNDLKNNNTASASVKSISIVRHEFFEFYLNNIVNVSGTMARECQKYKPLTEQYIKECKTNISRDSTENCDIPPSINGWSTNLFQACVQWIQHGGSERTVGKSQIFLKHVHYGTYTKANFALHHPGPNITDILPRAILHLN